MAEQLQTITSQLEGVITTPLTSTSTTELEKAKEKVKSITSELEGVKVTPLEKIPKIESITSQLEGTEIVPLMTDTSAISTETDIEPAYGEPTFWEKISYGVDKQDLFFGNLYRVAKAGVQAAFDPDREFKEVAQYNEAVQNAELASRHKKFASGKYDSDGIVQAAAMATFILDPYYLLAYMTPWGRAATASLKGIAMIAGTTVGLDSLIEDLAEKGEVDWKDVGISTTAAATLGPLTVKAFRAIAKRLPGADKKKILQVVQAIEGKKASQLGITKAEFKTIQKIAGDEEFRALNSQIQKAGKIWVQKGADQKKAWLHLEKKLDKQFKKLKKIKEPSETVADKIIKVQQRIKAEKKAYNKAQTEFWTKASVESKKVQDLIANRDVMFMEKLWKARTLPDKVVTALISATIRPLLGAGIGWGFGKLWGPDDANLNNWMMAGAILGGIHKGVMKSKIIPGQKRMSISRILYNDGTALAFQKVRELTSTTTFSKLASIGGETEKIGLMLLEGVDASLSPNSATAVADKLHRIWQKKAFQLIGGYSKEDEALAIAIVRGSKQSASPKIMRLVSKLRKELSTFKKLYNDAGIFSVYDKSHPTKGGKLLPEIKDYFPRVWNFAEMRKDPVKFEKIITDIFKSLGKKDKAAKGLAFRFTNSLKTAENSVINQEIRDILVKGLEKPRIKYNLISKTPLSEHITKERMLHGPYAKVEKILEKHNYLINDIPQVLNNLYSRSMRSIAFAQKFGARGELLKPYIISIREKYKATGRDDWEKLAAHEVKLVMNSIDGFFERYGNKQVGIHKSIAGILSTISNLNMLDRVTIASLGDLVQPFTTSNNYTSFWRGLLRTALTPGKETGIARNLNYHLNKDITTSLMRTTGITQRFDDATMAANMMGNTSVMRKANEIGFKVMGLQWLTGFARRYAYNTGAVDIFHTAQKIGRFVSKGKSLSSREGLYLTKGLDRYGINIQDALKLAKFKNFDAALKSKVAKDVLNRAGIVASNRDALIPQVSNRLLFTQSRNPWIRLMGQFTSWAMAKSTQTNKLLQRIENGDSRQMVKLLAALPLYGGIQMLREIAKYGEVKTDPGTQEGKWWAEAMRLSGMAGILPELFIGRLTGPGAKDPWFLPFPFISVLGDVGDVVKKGFEGETNKAWRIFLDKIAPMPTWRRWLEKLFLNKEVKYPYDDTNIIERARKKFAKGDVVSSAAMEDAYIEGDKLNTFVEEDTIIVEPKKKDMNKKDIAALATAATLATTGVDADINKAVENNLLPIEKEFQIALKESESSGNYDVVNTEGFMGAYQFGNARLKDYKKATGEKFDNKTFIKDKKLQDKVFKWHTNDIKNYITKNKLDSYIGKEINGVLVTLNGLIAVAHLGGNTGMRKFLQSNGEYNPSDSVGTSLTDYLNKFKTTKK